MPLAALGPILIGAAGTSAAATTAAWGAIAAGTMAASNIYGATKQASAARDAAQLQTTAANHGADAQAKAAADALAFQKEQAARDFAMAETNRRANYDQWASSQQRLSSLGDMLGLGPRAVPGYVPLTPPTSSAPSTAPAAAGAAPTGGSGIDWTAPPDQLGSNLSAFFKAKGVSDHEVPYWVSKAPELVARAREINDPQYADKRLFAAEVFGGAGAAPAAAASARSAYAPTAGSIGSFLAPPMTPALTAPSPYGAGSLGSYFRA